jgi:hypothetical protein
MLVWLRVGAWIRQAMASSRVWSCTAAWAETVRRSRWEVRAVWAWWSRLLRTAAGEMSSPSGTRWTRDGVGRFERSSRRTLERVWGARAARSRVAGSRGNSPV